MNWFLAAMGGLVASAVLLVAGLRVGDRLVVVAAGLAAIAFMVAVLVYGGSL